MSLNWISLMGSGLGGRGVIRMWMGRYGCGVGGGSAASLRRARGLRGNGLKIIRAVACYKRRPPGTARLARDQSRTVTAHDASMYQAG